MFHIIINPKSRTGKGLGIWKIVKNELDKRKISYQSYFTHYEFHAIKITKKICNENVGNKHIIVLGGDGTVNEVLNGITSYKDVFFSYIPSGSSNDLARSLGISKDPIKALISILEGSHYRYIDTGLLQIDSNLRKFGVSCGIGFDAAICYEALNSKIKILLNKLKLGKLTYLAIAMKQILTYQPINGEIIIDQTKHIKLNNIFFIASMIHKYEGGGLSMAPKANPKDKKLSVCVIYNMPKIKTLLLLPALFLEKTNHFKEVKIFDCTSLEIHTKEKIVIHTDGEFAGRRNHLMLSCTKEQIRMVL